MGMDSSSAQHHHQEMSSQTLESMLLCSKGHQEKKARPSEQQTLKCPRCDSTNTKFCYYNNYSLSQPRYFCKSCRRYWTKGGTLRNIPVGGGCRKTKRPSSSSSSSTTSSSSSKRINSKDQPITTLPNYNPMIPCLGSTSNLPYDSNDLTLAIARLQKQTCGQLGFDDHDFSTWANQNMPRGHDSNQTVLETPPNGNIQNLCYGMGMGMGIPYEELVGGGPATSTAVSTVRDEIYSAREDETRVLLGFPWHGIGGDCDLGNIGECDSERQNWNGIGSSNWQGLLNSPLM